MMCVSCCVHLCVIGYIWKTRNTRVGKHDLRGSKNNNELEIFINFVRPEKFQFLEKGQNRNFGYKIVISIKNPEFIL